MERTVAHSVPILAPLMVAAAAERLVFGLILVPWAVENRIPPPSKLAQQVMVRSVRERRIIDDRSSNNSNHQ
uniref:Putative secreted protein n=1 Tax=Anopheles darlingi TaxID=43151 RepID=A0A2M4D3F8_ANODA